MPGRSGNASRTSRGMGQTRRAQVGDWKGAAIQSRRALQVDTPWIASSETSSRQTNSVASTWSALRRSGATARPKYPASARRLRRGRPGRRRRAISCVQTISSGSEPPARRSRNGRSKRAKWMTVGPGCRGSLDASCASSRHASSRSMPSLIMESEMPVIRATAGGMRSHPGSSIRRARTGDAAGPARAQPSSSRYPRGLAAVA
jgi:hypothetical protein